VQGPRVLRSLVIVCCLLAYRMGLLSSKRQVSEKGKGWSPVKIRTQDKAPPPLPPLVSDQPLPGQGLSHRVLPEAAALGSYVSMTVSFHSLPGHKSISSGQLESCLDPCPALSVTVGITKILTEA
jgi:hypothetical protein